MGEKTDQAKGRIKQAAGDLTDDADLKNARASSTSSAAR